MKRIDYKAARNLMLPGDVIAFGGKGFVSNVIKIATRCPVSHVGVILQTSVSSADKFINQIIESTSLEGSFAGVQINRMSIHIERYKGDIWWLPLSTEIRKSFNQSAFFNFMLSQENLMFMDITHGNNIKVIKCRYPK